MSAETARLNIVRDKLSRLKDLCSTFGFMVDEGPSDFARAIGELSWIAQDRFEEIEADLKSMVAKGSEEAAS